MKWKHIFSVAPMMEYTDIHQRFLFRQLSKHSVLYTEMVTANTLCRGTPEVIQRHLAADFPIEDLVVLQLGGSDPSQMAQAAKIAVDYGYKEINLNVGCPSDKVAGKGCFGAALMRDPSLVATLCQSISTSTGVPTTVKCRIGVNDNDSYEELHNFIHTINSKAQVTHFIVHARKAILNANFSPDDNRKIPPLNYDFVYKLLQDFPQVQFTINGGVNTIEDAQLHLAAGVGGVMVGRAVVNTPFHWRSVDSELYCDETTPRKSRREVMEAYAQYALQVEASEGARCRNVLMKPVLGMFAGAHNGRLFRRRIDELMRDKDKFIGDVMMEAMLSSLETDVLNEC